ncbi:hypothetical protein F5890DRAFT_1532462 [Lentinula detonsa]|uniref:Secreted protein n=1 Tax=Lentinula detonsa TaxID=2804962 RepID=A0AA38PUF6_9AGAR|nr:hypothetical protein F5890DRAFT_1532462 [Lentinula detonsa]
MFSRTTILHFFVSLALWANFLVVFASPLHSGDSIEVSQNYGCANSMVYAQNTSIGPYVLATHIFRLLRRMRSGPALWINQHCICLFGKEMRTPNSHPLREWSNSAPRSSKMIKRKKPLSMVFSIGNICPCLLRSQVGIVWTLSDTCWRIL